MFVDVFFIIIIFIIIIIINNNLILIVTVTHSVTRANMLSAVSFILFLTCVNK